MAQPFVVSAPGKVILFGEHSAVYGKPAIAAALSLRAFLLAVPSEDPTQIVLEFPDIGLLHKWSVHDIDWDALPANASPGDSLDDSVMTLIESLLSTANLQHYIACRLFLYLYVHLCSKHTPGHRFCIRLTLPIGAGLGSSALVAVCMSTALAVLGNRISEPDMGLAEQRSVQSADADLIDRWLYMGEMCFHGNPLGIDNAVATHGGAILYVKGGARTKVRNFPALHLLLTNTRVPRSTADLVGGVAVRNGKFTKPMAAIIEAMGALAETAYAEMTALFVDKAKLAELVDINHGLLVALGVSHPALEKIKMISDTHKLGATKLTGAGGGGCAITLVSDGTKEAVERAKAEFEAAGFESYETLLGGKGVGMMRHDVDAGQFVKWGRGEIEAQVGVLQPGWRFW